MKSTLAGALAIAGCAVSANAADLDGGGLKDPLPDGPLTFHGITFYGTIDAGYSYQTHGATANSFFISGLDYMVASSTTKNLKGGVSSIAPNGLEQSKVGVKGEEALGYGFTGIFNFDTGFNPLSGDLSNGPGSIAQNNGKSVFQQSAFGDSSRAGQIFNGQAYFGLSNPSYGTLTVGRQNSLLLDAIREYDPQALSYAFSLIGFSGFTGGGGDTEDARLNDSVKYTYTYGPVHVGGLFAEGGGGNGLFGNGYGANAGGSYRGFSLDAVYEKMNGAVSASTLPVGSAICGGGVCPTNGFGGTISDNETFSVQGKYTFEFGGEGFKDEKGGAKLTLYGGYEHVALSNPSDPVLPGTTTQGGYLLYTTNNTKYATDRVQQVYWTGAKYELPSGWSFTGAYYGYDQNSYLTGAGRTTCVAATAANIKAGTPGVKAGDNCAGNLSVGSFVIDYQWTKHLDLYAGVTYSTAADGLASGFLNNETTSFMTGARLKF